MRLPDAAAAAGVHVVRPCGAVSLPTALSSRLLLPRLVWLQALDEVRKIRPQATLFTGECGADPPPRRLETQTGNHLLPAAVSIHSHAFVASVHPGARSLTTCCATHLCWARYPPPPPPPPPPLPPTPSGMMHLVDHDLVSAQLRDLQRTEGLRVGLAYDGLRVPACF